MAAGHYEAIRAVIEATPSWSSTPGILSQTRGHQHLHFDTECLSGAGAADLAHTSHTGPVGELLAGLLDPRSLRICHECTNLAGDADPQIRYTKQGLWHTAYVYEYAAKAASAVRLGRPSSQAATEQHVSTVLMVTGTFLADDPETIWPNTPPELADLIVKQWHVGRAHYEELLSWKVATANLDQPIFDDNELVVCEKGPSFADQWRDPVPHPGKTMRQVALLEGPRLGQTSDLFITPMTWSAPTRALNTRSTFPNPRVQDPAAYTAALELWDCEDLSDLPDLIRSADLALRS
jgi:hypothetical protein